MTTQFLKDLPIATEMKTSIFLQISFFRNTL